MTLVVLLLSCLPAAALAPPELRDGVYRVRGIHPQSQPGAVQLTAPPRRAGQWVEPDAWATPLRAFVYATDNGNTRYSLGVSFPPGTCDLGGVVVLGNGLVGSSAYGHAKNECMLFFELTPALATRAAAVLGTGRRDRSEIGQWVTGRFAPTRPVYAAGQPVEIVLWLESPPEVDTIRWKRGGRSRGPRDNQFSFTITRDGQALPPIAGFDMGGISTRESLPGGGRSELRTPLAPWGDVGVPGRYVVECRYETVLLPDGVEPYDPAHDGTMWDRAFTGTVTFEVR